MTSGSLGSVIPQSGRHQGDLSELQEVFAGETAQSFFVDGVQSFLTSSDNIVKFNLFELQIKADANAGQMKVMRVMNVRLTMSIATLKSTVEFLTEQVRLLEEQQK